MRGLSPVLSITPSMTASDARWLSRTRSEAGGAAGFDGEDSAGADAVRFAFMETTLRVAAILSQRRAAA